MDLPQNLVEAAGLVGVNTSTPEVPIANPSEAEFEPTTFSFPGYKMIPGSAQDHGQFESQQGNLMVGDRVVTIVLRKGSRAPSHLVSKVLDLDGNPLWRHDPIAHQGMLCMLAHTDDGDVIALVRFDQGEKCVVEVIPLCGLPATTKDSNIKRRLRLKTGAASFLGAKYELDKTEGLVQARVLKELDEQRRTADEDARTAREQARLQRCQLIMMRERVRVRVRNANRELISFDSVPVTDEEWQSLENGTPCVRFERVEDGVGIGEPTVMFKVKRQTGRNPEKESERPVVTDAEIRQLQQMQQCGTVAVIIDGDFLDVPHYYSLAAVKVAHANGLNGGTPVAFGQKGSDGYYQVVRVNKKGISKPFKCEELTA